MKITNLKTIALLALATSLPRIANAITYDADGAILLTEEPAATSSNLIAAIGGANLSLSCLGLVALMIATVYIFHEIWHPDRVHDEMTETEITQGSIRFYIGGSLIWMLIAIMAEKWCVILPLGLILAGAIVYYIITLTTAIADEE